jgi:AmiR/NasT family two-component response regulator
MQAPCRFFRAGMDRATDSHRSAQCDALFSLSRSMPPPLLFALADPAEPDCTAAFADVQQRLGLARDGHNLVQAVSGEAPEQIILLAAGLTAAVASALSSWHGAPPCAVLLLTPPTTIDAALATRAFELGIHHWQTLAPDADAAATLEAAGAIALARHRQDVAHRRALGRAHAQLEDRRWIDRAKGALMNARGLNEGEAFGLLRGAAMSVNLRLGEVSRAVFEATQWAEAMNRAGQLRMLSQRLVRTAAQRLLKIDTRDAAVLSTVSAQRVRDNLDMLARQCEATPAQSACAEATMHWQSLAAALSLPRLDAPALLRIDELAAGLLDAAERLTQALQEASGRRALHIVNECGRQRMRAQRVAKESLMAALGRAPQDTRQRDEALAEFEAAQRELEQAPLTSGEIRATLARVRDEWLRMLGGLRGAQTTAGRHTIVHASEALLDLLDTLTAAYEHSLQVIIG